MVVECGALVLVAILGLGHPKSIYFVRPLPREKAATAITFYGINVNF